MLQLFRDRYDASTLEQRTPLLLVQSAIDDVKLPDASVDTVVIAAVLLHNPKPMTRAVLARRTACSGPAAAHRA